MRHILQLVDQARDQAAAKVKPEKRASRRPLGPSTCLGSQDTPTSVAGGLSHTSGRMRPGNTHTLPRQWENRQGGIGLWHHHPSPASPPRCRAKDTQPGCQIQPPPQWPLGASSSRSCPWASWMQPHSNQGPSRATPHVPNEAAEETQQEVHKPDLVGDLGDDGLLAVRTHGRNGGRLEKLPLQHRHSRRRP